MAHQIETFSDGTAAFVSARQSAWHRLGTVAEGCLTAAQAMKTAYLDRWNVRKIGIEGAEVSEEGVETVRADDRWMTVRTHPKTGKLDYLGIVGSDYTPVQNEECCDLLDTIVDEAGAHYETAGSLRGGRSVFVTIKLPTAMQIAGVDDLDLYLAVNTSHDGKSQVSVDATPIRIVCANTQQLALRQSRARYSFRHVPGAKKSHVAHAREALGIIWDYYTEFESEAEHMINESLTAGEFERIIAQVWPLKDDVGPRALNNQKRRDEELHQLFSGADTQANIRGTRWAGYQAIAEYLDHFAPAKSDEVRATRVLTTAAVATKKQLAFELLSV